MDKKSAFTYTPEQQLLHICELRINGLRVGLNMDLPFYSLQQELDRLTVARDDILTRISKTDLDNMRAYEKNVRTPAERAEQAKIVSAAMMTNRVRPST